MEAAMLVSRQKSPRVVFCSHEQGQGPRVSSFLATMRRSARRGDSFKIVLQVQCSYLVMPQKVRSMLRDSKLISKLNV